MNGTSNAGGVEKVSYYLNEILSEITDRTNEARQAYEDYNSAIEGGDYNDLFENYQKAYESLGEMFDNQEFGEKFYRTVQYLFGEGHANDSIESLKSQYNSLKIASFTLLLVFLFVILQFIFPSSKFDSFALCFIILLGTITFF